ncbi:MAG: hypothetical protein ABI175_18840, partial [Polyangiales bacterium]
SPSSARSRKRSPASRSDRGLARTSSSHPSRAVLIIVIGLLVVSIPVALAARTVRRLTHRLGSADGTQVGVLVRKQHDVDLVALARTLLREAPGSIPQRLLSAVTDPGEGEADRTELARRLALAEAVADVERDVIDDIRVPRVAASLATTSGLLAAALVMREGLGATYEGGGAEVIAQFQVVIERGLTLAAIAVLGGVVCASLHRAAQRQRRQRLDELDALSRPLAARFGVVPDEDLR